jgi:outer membrane lipoprotein
MTAMRRVWVLVLAVVVSGCATIVPPDLAGRLNRRLSAQELLSAPEQYAGQVVMIGGEILSVRNTPGGAELEILQRALELEEPMFTDRTAGRFLARHPGFLDPAVYEVGRRVTIVGVVAAPVERKIDEVDHRYAVIDAQKVQLWPAQTWPSRYYRYPPPYWADPYWYGYPYWWYGPYYPHWDPYWYRWRRPRH